MSTFASAFEAKTFI